MFKHILVPTDGTELATEALKNAIKLAGQSGASLTCLHVMPDYDALGYQMEMLAITREAYLSAARERVERTLAEASKLAAQAGVKMEVRSTVHNHPWRAIVDETDGAGCDLIAMASHGRGGIESLLIGSETQKVLTHSRVPVLVFR
ncbi:MAG: universal stress protein [Dokdonella sp.]|nr:universal stress protein [Dokdonella sp.]MCB1573429.1 universal stress protein [Xanthomonadales bacterium]